jgi:outer membrane lipoprotein carrier protein
MFRSFICVSLLLAPAASVRTIVRALEQRYHHASTLKAAFYERYTDGSGGIAAESGTVYFSRPGRMRWEYEFPERKLFLVDGTNVWFYVPADHTASRAKLKESSDWRTPLALLAGKADLSNLCRDIEMAHGDVGQDVDPKDDQPKPPGDTVLRCIPRDVQGPNQDVLLETDPDVNLVRVVIHEPGDVTTEFRFGNWQEDIALPEVMFHFEPPPGVAIVNEDSLAGEIR